MEKAGIEKRYYILFNYVDFNMFNVYVGSKCK